jgi:hypothetical protein
MRQHPFCRTPRIQRGAIDRNAEGIDELRSGEQRDGVNSGLNNVNSYHSPDAVLSAIHGAVRGMGRLCRLCRSIEEVLSKSIICSVSAPPLHMRHAESRLLASP